MIRNVAQAAQWREGLQKVEVLDDKRFREHSKFGAMTYEVIEDDPGRKMVTKIIDRDLGFGGSWTYVLEDAPGGTRLTSTENGEITNVFFRFMARFVFGYTGAMET